MVLRATTALNRFGYGARPGDKAPSDGAGWLEAQFNRFQVRPAAFSRLASRDQIADAIVAYRDFTRTPEGKAALGERREAAQAAKHAALGSASHTATNNLMQKNAALAKLDGYDFATQQNAMQIIARIQSAVETDTPFVERMVHFWANHFAVSADKRLMIGFAGLMEFEAIRPHVLGRFEDMLIAVEQHPAMLLYLDQPQSIGRDSALAKRVSKRAGKLPGLNENLAREILELHTLGARSDYTQADIIAFAQALTGWGVSGIFQKTAGANGRFGFAAARHEPGARTFMGKTYGQSGEDQALAILRDVAASRATAIHLATKLARHFTGDEPEPALVTRLAESFHQSGGHLPTVYRTLIEAPEPGEGIGKFKSPWDWTISTLRAIGKVPDQTDRSFERTLWLNGQPVWRPGSPNGFGDLDADWASPSALIQRLETASRWSVGLKSAIDARALAHTLFPDQPLSDDTSEVISGADSAGQAVSLLLVSPEFLRR
ncbi:DUF1800 domain-containing protein [Novosphingobium aquimarinum]|uniref:DUF1800 domain-containing protein n=1 Tax=Novosphingobium aquimarinum TaxID=2682494 RepID=UPI0012EB9707|nr:DUF1800 domain-containing protein [Novosphingobium aquimarinum]